MVKKKAEIIIFILSLAVVVFIGLNTNRFFFRIDLTENKAFTISKVSKSLFQEIPDRVFITYYISDKLKTLYSFPSQVEDLLYEYSAFSRGKIKVSTIDPVKTGELREAEALGVHPQQIEIVEKDERSYASVYSGIVIHYLDRHETIPLAFRLETLEFDLTSKIRRIVTDSERVIGILSGDNSRKVDSSYNALKQILSGDFKVIEVESGKDVPEEVTALFVMGNIDLDDFDLYPIDQFLMNGGRILFAVEGVKIDLMRGLAASKLEESPLLDMLLTYGVDVKREYVLDKYCKNFRIPTQVFGQTMWQILDKYPQWITIADRYVSKENPITARFSGLDLYWASPLELLKRDNVSAELLVQTTPDAWIMSEPFETNPQKVGILQFINQDTKGQYPVAVSLSGSFTSFFKSKNIPSREGEERDWKEARISGSDARIIVIGDADFASELYQYTNAAYNLEFLSNSAEWLSNSEDLLEIKTRISRDMRLNKIQDQAKRIRASVFTQVFNLVFIPLLVILCGILRLIYRRKKSTQEE